MFKDKTFIVARGDACPILASICLHITTCIIPSSFSNIRTKSDCQEDNTHKFKYLHPGFKGKIIFGATHTLLLSSKGIDIIFICPPGITQKNMMGKGLINSIINLNYPGVYLVLPWNLLSKLCIISRDLTHLLSQFKANILRLFWCNKNVTLSLLQFSVTKTLQLHKKRVYKIVTPFSHLIYKDYYFVTKT